MRITARFFASSRDAVGLGELELDIEAGSSVQTLLARLISDYPKLAGYAPHLMVAVNAEYAERSTALHPGDEVAFIPPVSGGSHAV